MGVSGTRELESVIERERIEKALLGVLRTGHAGDGQVDG